MAQRILNKPKLVLRIRALIVLIKNYSIGSKYKKKTFQTTENVCSNNPFRKTRGVKRVETRIIKIFFINVYRIEPEQSADDEILSGSWLNTSGEHLSPATLTATLDAADRELPAIDGAPLDNEADEREIRDVSGEESDTDSVIPAAYRVYINCSHKETYSCALPAIFSPDPIIPAAYRIYNNCLYKETYSCAPPATLTPESSLIVTKFCTSSSHTTVRGLDSVAARKLLCTLLDMLKRTFSSSANSEDFFFLQNRPCILRDLLTLSQLWVAT